MKIACVLFALFFVHATSGSAAPLSGSWEARSLILPAGTVALKVSDTQLCLDAALHLAIALSGLDVRSRTSFSLVGVETEFLSVHATIGAISLNGTLIFSRNIIEADSAGLIKEISPNPGGLVGTYLPFLPSFTDPVTPLVALCRMLEPTLVGQPVLFRKKIAEATLMVAGIKLSGTFLFANLGFSGMPALQVGTVLGASGQTVSGIEFAALTYIGMRNEDGFEFECFGQCHDAERFYQGRLVPGFRFEMERIQIKNVSFAGVKMAIDSIFNFNGLEGAVGLKEVTLTSSAHIQPLSLSLTDILTLDSTLNLATHTVVTTLELGEGYLTAVLTDVADPTNDVGFEFQTFIASFTLGDWNLASTLYLCAEQDTNCTFLHATYQHDITWSYAKENLRLSGLLQFYGFISSFNKSVLTLDWTLGAIALHSGTAIQADRFTAQAFSISLKF
jgi:hypothetical protein